MAMKRVKVYHLYPTMGGYTAKSIAYHGQYVAVAAVSIKQAYYFAHNDIWAESVERPAGKLYEYYRGSGTKVFTGRWTADARLKHGAGIRAIQQFMRQFMRSHAGG